MDNLEIRTRIINLGKALVKELKLDPGVDTFSRWMAHYVAEQMTLAENATGDEKIAAEKRCFETILKLWQHRSSLPNGHRPLENFDPIFNALNRLDPDNPRPYYFSSSDNHSSETGDVNNLSDEIQQWVDIARGIDRGSRLLIEFVFHQAALLAVDEKMVNWLTNAVDIPPDEDISIIVHLTHTYEDVEEEASKKEENTQKEKLQSRIKQLDAFIAFSQELRSSFNELMNMTNKDAVPHEDNLL